MRCRCEPATIEAFLVLAVATGDKRAEHGAEESQRQRNHGRVDQRPQRASAPRIAGPIIASTTEEIRPTVIPPTTPLVLKRRQNSDRISTGKFALAAMQIARITSTATLTP